MKYLQKSFSVMMSSPRPKEGRDYLKEEARRKKASEPHEFSGGAMCLICCLDPRAGIHIKAGK